MPHQLDHFRLLGRSGAPDQLACNFERGRQIWLGFSLRPLSLAK
jgi:hypothetical protein